MRACRAAPDRGALQPGTAAASLPAGEVDHVDVTVIGAGAAGTFAALAARGALAPDGRWQSPGPDAPDVLLVDGQQQPGRKILISGGGRCNVTNAVVSHDDFVTTAPRTLRTQLLEFPPEAVVRFFAEAGVPLTEEPMGKLFPADDRRARDVLAAIHRRLDEAGVVARYGEPVEDVTADGDGWLVDGRPTHRVVVATGGRSVPATGSTGFGLDLAERLGHQLVTPVPALAALLGGGDTDLAGVQVPAILTAARRDGSVLRRTAGSLLFTHRGVTGPAALDLAEVLERHEDVVVHADVWSLLDPDGPMGAWLDAPKLPGACLPEAPPPADVGAVDDTLQALVEAANPGTTLGTVLARRLPRALATAIAGDAAGADVARLPRAVRRRTAHHLAELELGVTATAGYASAEVTAGGVALDELDRRTLESRVAPGSHWCGEVCDVTGRLGGFNFQWAWTSGFLAGRAAGRQRS